MTVLVTGGQGFIGTWLVERLLADGADVVVPSRPAAEDARFWREGLDERCTAAPLDLLDVTSIWRVLNELDVRVVFHLAAATIAGEARESPLEAFATNVRGTYTLLEACRLARASGQQLRVVVASTYHVYGPHGNTTYTERLPLRPRYPYEVSKACADMIASGYAATYEMPVAVARLANVYGGGDLNFSRLLPDTARALVAGQRPVIRSAGTAERDYLYAEDAAEAYLAVADSLEDTAFWGRTWNAGSGTPVAVAQMVRGLVAAAGQDIEPDIRGKADPQAEIDRQYLDSSAIRDELDWQPRWELDDGLRETWDWYARNLA